MAMVRHHLPPPPPPPPPPPLPPPSAPYPALPPAPAHASLLRHVAHHPAPQQYAHPLTRHNAYPAPQSDHGRPSKPPEHMLRRKTPNGILAAAYDGTSVEHSEKPHATKHILLPFSAASTPPFAPTHDLPLRASTHAQHDAPQDWSPSLYFETGSGRAGQHLPQIDSMLNQIPPLQPLLPYQMYGQPFCGAMNPPLQAPLGPTVSNDQGPYGPYWHDGTFIPYRPAAVRDPQFMHHPSHSWAHPQHGAYMTPAYNSPVPHPSYLPSSHLVNQGSNAFSLPGPRPVDFGFRSPSHSLPIEYQTPFTPQRPRDLLGSGQTTPVAEYPPTSSPADYGPPLDDRPREWVFNWAHSSYVNLLRHLQSTRKPQSHSHGRTPSRPQIYPKPPRQPGARPAVFSSDHPDRRRSISGSNHSASTQSSEHKLHTHIRSSSAWRMGTVEPPRRSPWNAQPSVHSQPGMEPPRTLRRMSGSIANVHGYRDEMSSLNRAAASSLEALTKRCEESSWTWIEGMLLGGCLAYALGDYQKAQNWYKHILTLDKDHVEAISNLAATLLALQQKREAENYWKQAIKLRPSHFEAVEHLIGLLCQDHRAREAVQVIEEVERCLKVIRRSDIVRTIDDESQRSTSTVSESTSISDADRPVFEFEGAEEPIVKDLEDLPGSDQPGFASSGYAIPGCDNGRILALVHAKGNMLYALGDNIGAAKAFENAVLIGAGPQVNGVNGLIQRILSVVGYNPHERSPGGRYVPPSTDPVLLPPESATKTAQLCFPSHGQLPGLKHVPSDGMARKAAISTTSNSLLSLAKIFQDGMATNSPKVAHQSNYGVREILALYYLSLSLQPSPSTANNVGILLASVQQSAPSKPIAMATPLLHPNVPGLVPGSGVALALAYYYYGLQLDKRHAHLYTNLGSLLKDIGQLDVAISMYEQAVNCDQNFDIALANLANAVKDKGRISDAIHYYKRAVKASPDFAEAVCGLANALNSVCWWDGRGGIADNNGERDRWHVDDNGMLLDARLPGASSSGWINKVVRLVEKQLADGEDWGRGTMDEHFLQDIMRPLALTNATEQELSEKQNSMKRMLIKWRGHKWEGARAVRLVERAIRCITWQWYQDRYVTGKQRHSSNYQRPQLPAGLTVPAAPTVLPFHTFTCPMSASQIRLISQRNGLRISCSTLRVPWLPQTVYQPPTPPKTYLKVGYVSSDFNNHPLAHLMQSVFGMHDPNRVKAYCFATTASDGSEHRKQIEREAPVFYDASNWSAERLVNQIISDGIHILINLNGYTRGARNEVFAARPAPIQMAFMGFAGTLGAEWCDYLLADEIAIPPSTLRPWRRNIDMEDALVDENSGGSDDQWIYGENIIFCRDTFFCCDHRQSAPDSQSEQHSWDEEQKRRWAMRKEIFPQLKDDAVILGNFNQLYKIEPTTFRTWLRILERLPNAILWLLRFPDLGESHLRATAKAWAGSSVAARIVFTDVAHKSQHISRARVCDLFLDTPECNAHTTAADVLWSGTPLLTFPRYGYKMCSRMAASILQGALPKSAAGAAAADELIAPSEARYEDMAVRLGRDCAYDGFRARGRLAQLRKLLWEARWESALFDTRRWVDELEGAYEVAWARWVRGEGGDVWLERELGPRRGRGGGRV